MGKSKSLNPADAERKKARLREIKKNKANRTAQRAEKLFSSPEALRAEIDKWRRLRPGQIGEDGEKLDPASIANRIKKLEESLATLLRQRRVRRCARGSRVPLRRAQTRGTPTLGTTRKALLWARRGAPLRAARRAPPQLTRHAMRRRKLRLRRRQRRRGPR
jgi:hypothetical protein